MCGDNEPVIRLELLIVEKSKRKLYLCIFYMKMIMKLIKLAI